MWQADRRVKSRQRFFLLLFHRNALGFLLPDKCGEVVATNISLNTESVSQVTSSCGWVSEFLYINKLFVSGLDLIIFLFFCRMHCISYLTVQKNQSGSIRRYFSSIFFLISLTRSTFLHTDTQNIKLNEYFVENSCWVF